MKNGKPPKTLPEWIAYLHAVRAVPQDSPDYADAQEAVRFALGRIRTLNAVANAQQPGAPDEQVRPIGPGAAAGAGLMHGLSLGAGEPLAGLLAALVPGGQGFREGAQQYRQGLENIGVQQPTATPTGEMAGLAMQSAVPVARAVRGGTATAAAIPSARAGVLARFFTGAGQADVVPAMTMGGIAGFSAGGEDPGDLNARLQGGAAGAGLGAAGAAFLGGLGSLRVPRWLTGVKRQMRQAVPKGTPPEVVDGLTEAAIRQQLARDGHDAASQSRVLAAWRAGKADVPPVPPPPTVRPGETIAPIDPLASPAYQRSGQPIPEPRSWKTPQGKGVGGHSYTGTYPAGTAAGPGRTVPSPVGGPGTMAKGQMDVLAQFLQGATPADLPARLETMRGMGVQLPPDAQTQLLQILLGGH